MHALENKRKPHAFKCHERSVGSSALYFHQKTTMTPAAAASVQTSYVMRVLVHNQCSAEARQNKFKQDFQPVTMQHELLLNQHTHIVRRSSFSLGAMHHRGLTQSPSAIHSFAVIESMVQRALPTIMEGPLGRAGRHAAHSHQWEQQMTAS